jgi:hypothetical protein
MKYFRTSIGLGYRNVDRVRCTEYILTSSVLFHHCVLADYGLRGQCALLGSQASSWGRAQSCLVGDDKAVKSTLWSKTQRRFRLRGPCTMTPFAINLGSLGYLFPLLRYDTALVKDGVLERNCGLALLCSGSCTVDEDATRH